MLPVSETRIYILGVQYRSLNWIRDNNTDELVTELRAKLEEIPTLEYRNIRIINQYSRLFGKTSEIHIKNVFYNNKRHLSLNETDELRLSLLNVLPMVNYLNYQDISVLDDNSIFRSSIQF